MLHVHPDQSTPGLFAVQSSSAAALAAIPDGLVQGLSQPGDRMASWMLHHDEQDGSPTQAYTQERDEIGVLAQIEVVELHRPYQQNVVWVDRYHLLATAAEPVISGRLFGFYVGTKGHIVSYVYHPSSAASVLQHLQELPRSHEVWRDPNIIGQVRSAVAYFPKTPNTVYVAVAPTFGVQGQQALQRVAAATSGW